MNYMIWAIAGAILGWLTTIIIRNRRTDLLFNMVVGIVSALITGYLLTPIFHINLISPGNFSLPALLVSLIGAVILLVVVNFFRRDNNVKNHVVEGKWDQVSSKIHARWGNLTDQDIAKINRNHEQFNITLQERYGYAKEEAENQIQRYLKAVLHV
ncbi:MAG: GlsB/YeaQ/YmgE family stress response membrane protein [Omnitrophica WOR_2 bacterium]